MNRKCAFCHLESEKFLNLVFISKKFSNYPNVIKYRKNVTFEIRMCEECFKVFNSNDNVTIIYDKIINKG